MNLIDRGVPPLIWRGRPSRLTRDEELINRLRDLAWEERHDAAKEDLLYEVLERLEQLTRGICHEPN